jgi:hypothetical protein
VCLCVCGRIFFFDFFFFFFFPGEGCRVH